MEQIPSRKNEDIQPSLAERRFADLVGTLGSATTELILASDGTIVTPTEDEQTAISIRDGEVTFRYHDEPLRLSAESAQQIVAQAAERERLNSQN